MEQLNDNIQIKESEFKQLEDYKLKPTTKLVYLGLLFYRGYETNACYPSYSTLESFTGVSKRCIATSIKELEKKGILIVLSREFNSSVYMFPMKYNLLDADETKELAEKVVIQCKKSDYDINIWTDYFNKFVLPLREKKLEESKAILLSQEKIEVELTAEEKANLIF